MKPNRSRSQPEVESREETIDRIEREHGRGVEAAHEPGGTDPTSRRRIGRRSLLRATVVGLGVAIPVAIVALVASSSVGLAIGLAGAVLIGTGVVIALFGAMEEDGRIEQDVEHVVEERR